MRLRFSWILGGQVVLVKRDGFVGMEVLEDIVDAERGGVGMLGSLNGGWDWEAVFGSLGNDGRVV